jgi:hypothetical protein
LYVYNSILDKKVGKTHEEPTNNFKMIPNFLRFFFEILRVCLARHTNIDELKTKEKAQGVFSKHASSIKLEALKIP